MNQAWQDFLATQHAILADGRVQRFGDMPDELAATQNATVLCDLSQFGTLKVSGEDAQDFLQNLLSNDIKSVTPAHAQLSSFNTAKGRILATFLIWQTAENYYLQLPRSQCAAIQKKLSMYVLRSKVTVTDISDDLICFGIAGDKADSIIEACFGAMPEDAKAVVQNSHGIGIRLNGIRYQIVAAPHRAAELWKGLSSGARPVGTPCWDWLNIRAGIPEILPATQELFVPQMVNLDLIGSVNFKKGCYPGQEIVARMQYLGKPKQRMFLAHVEGNTTPQPGDHLYSVDLAGQHSGTVVNAAPAPGGGYDLLAVVQISSRESQAVHLGSLQGAKLEFLPMPYTIT